jgi:hemoglobin/transferrin/lactoferrin receptor protein
MRSLLLAASAVLCAGAARAQQPDSAAADTTRRLREIEVRAGRAGASLPNPLLLLTATAVADGARMAEAPVRILPDALRELPGVQVQQTSAGHGTVILRGMVGNQVLLLLDGVRLNNATVRDGPNQSLSLIDPERVERVEVVRGPGSVLFGSDALGGVVNVVTRRVPRTAGGSATLAAGSADRGVRGRLAGWVPLTGRLRASASVAGDAVRDLEAGGPIGRQEGTSYRSASAQARAEYDAGSCENLALGVQGTTLNGVSRYDRLVTFRAPNPGADAEFSFTPQTHVLVTANYDARDCGGALRGRGATIGIQSQREGRLQRGQSATGGTVTPAPTREYQRDDVRTFVLAVHAEPALPPGTSLRTGADLYDDRVSAWGYSEDLATGARTPSTRQSGPGTVPAGRFPDGAHARYAGAYAHGARLLGPRLRALGGARFDVARVRLRAGDDFGGDVDQTNTALSAHAGLTWFAARDVSLSAHAGQGFRAPNIYDFATVTRVPGGVVIPSTSLGPERSVTWELSASLSRPTTRVTIAGYVTRLSDAIDRISGEYQGDTLFGGRRVFRAVNLASATLSGTELSASFERGRWGGRAQGFWTRGTQETPGGREAMAKIPPLSGSFALRRAVVPARGMWVEAVARTAGAQRRLASRDLSDTRIQPGGTPAWWTLGLRGGWGAGATRASFSLENLGDRGYREHSSGIDAPGRHLWVRLERRFGP